MLVYRVVPYLPQAPETSPGGTLYLHAGQGASRLDNPGHYRVWYFAQEASGAVGETFGNLAEWSEEMFLFPRLPGSKRSLVTYMLPDDLPLLELDDPKALMVRAIKPTQVIERNRAATQAWALDMFLERNNRGERAWSGIRWWSYHHPPWRIIGYWDDPLPKVLKIEDIDLRHPAVIDAAAALERPLTTEPRSENELDDATPEDIVVKIGQPRLLDHRNALDGPTRPLG